MTRSEDAAAANLFPVMMQRAMIRFARSVGIVLSMVAVAQVLSWARGAPMHFGASTAMNPMTAMALGALAISLLCRTRTQTRTLQKLASAIAVVVGAIAALQVLTNLVVYPGPDTWLFPEQLDQTSPPSRMAANTALNLFLLSVSLAFLDRTPGRAGPTTQWSAILSGSLLLLALVGYVFGTSQLYWWGGNNPMALATTVSLLLLAAAALAVRPDVGIMRVLSGDGPAGFAVRRLLPIALVTPLVIGMVRLAGEQGELFGPDTGRALAAVGTIVVFTWVSWWVARSIEAADIQRRSAERQMREALQMKSDFVAFVTHQLRTPLSGIKWMLELAKESDDRSEFLSYVQDARESADRLIHLVNDLLDVSRLESGKLQVTPQVVDLVRLTTDVLSEVDPLIRVKGHRVELAADLVPPHAMADPQLLRQVILNLISNAIKYTPGQGRIDVGISRRDRTVRWVVQDSGIGIPKEQQGRLFEKFYRADNAVIVDTEGTGLGLYFVRLIVERSGGKIGYASEEGAGAKFWFSIPSAPAPKEVT